MKKDEVYKLFVSLDNFSFDILTAVCGCPAGKGPTASCCCTVLCSNDVL